MEIENIFHVPTLEFKDTTHFHEYLVNNYDCEKVKHNLTMLVGITERTTDDLLTQLQTRGFFIERKLGVVYHLYNNIDNEKKIETYLSHDEKTGIMIFYSNYKKEDEIPKIIDFND